MATLVNILEKTKTIIEKLGDILLWPFFLLVVLLAVFYKEIFNTLPVWANRTIGIVGLSISAIVLTSGIISFVKLIKRKNEKNN